MICVGHLFRKYLYLAIVVMASAAIADGNKRERVYVATVDTLMSNTGLSYLASDPQPGFFEFKAPLTGRIQMKVDVVTPEGEKIEQSLDRTMKEFVDGHRSYSSKITVAAHTAKQGVFTAVTTTTKVEDDDTGQPQSETSTNAIDYNVVSGSWDDFLKHGSRVELRQSDASMADGGAQKERELVKAAALKGAKGRMLKFEQTLPTTLVAEAQNLTVTNPGVVRFVFEMRITEKNKALRAKPDLGTVR